MDVDDKWKDVHDAVAAAAYAYVSLLEVRADSRAGTKKVRKAQEAWEEAVEQRRLALLAQWDEAQDGMHGPDPSLGGVLRRYYQSRLVRLPKKRGKKA